MLALTTAAQQELARAGMALTDITRMYTEVDDAAAGTVLAAGSHIAANHPGEPGAHVSAGPPHAQTPPSAGGSAAERAPPRHR